MDATRPKTHTHYLADAARRERQLETLYLAQGQLPEAVAAGFMARLFERQVWAQSTHRQVHLSVPDETLAPNGRQFFPKYEERTEAPPAVAPPAAEAITKQGTGDKR